MQLTKRPYRLFFILCSLVLVILSLDHKWGDVKYPSYKVSINHGTAIEVSSDFLERLYGSEMVEETLYGYRGYVLLSKLKIRYPVAVLLVLVGLVIRLAESIMVVTPKHFGLSDICIFGGCLTIVYSMFWISAHGSLSFAPYLVVAGSVIYLSQLIVGTRSPNINTALV